MMAIDRVKRRADKFTLITGMVGMLGMIPVAMEGASGEGVAGWEALVVEDMGSGWERIEGYSYDGGSGWYWLAEAGVWVSLAFGDSIRDWEALVAEDMGRGWERIEGHSYNAGAGWQWLAEAEVWGWVVESEREPAEMVMVEGGVLSTVTDLDGTSVDTFYIGKYEVTWGEWQEVRDWAADNGYDIGNRGQGCAEDHPVYQVAWYDVVKWCNAKSEWEGLDPVYTESGEVYRTGEPDDHTTIEQDLTANGYRLPYEAEWEFAARGGNQSNGYEYAGSNDLDAVGWYFENSEGAACDLRDGRGTWPVGQKAANELGLYDMSGNVWEFCWDEFFGAFRRIRGGAWEGNANFSSVWASREAFGPALRDTAYGFRLARSSGN